LQDKEEKLITQAIRRAQIYFEKTLDNPAAIVAAMDNLIADAHGEGIANADIVIESIFENMVMKQELLQRIETQIKPSAFIATNTSSLLLEDLGKPLQDRSRLVGMHFFNPVTEMLLVELVKGQHTSQKILEKSLAFIGQLSKLPLQVKSSPGFLLNRCFVPYIVAAVNLLDEGVNAKYLDQAMETFGMSMGPIELMDIVGLDVCLTVVKNLIQYSGGKVPKRLQILVEEGKLGKKTGEGFYRFENDKPIKPDGTSTLTAIDIQHCLLTQIINAGVNCLQEGIISDKDMFDAGMLFGFLFPQFRGGPIHYAEQACIATEALNQLQ
jgi:3-hydroxyacyl-CoA dehydrogenase/enoyl-CoA hydratase/3-hydroxybutyryl-CoA epimerase